MGRRRAHDSDYEWDALESGYVDCEDDDDFVPSTPRKKKKAATASPRTPKATSPKSSKAASPKKGKSKLVEVVKDDKPFPLFDLPAEIINQILADPGLHLRDHLSLAATSVWRVLGSNRAFVGKGWGGSPGKAAVPSEADEKLLNHLWSREDRVAPDKVKTNVRAEEWEAAIDAVHSQRITKSTAKSQYKLNDSQLGKLYYQEKRNPHCRSGAPMQLYLEAAVESLAFEEHGGAAGHEELVKKREASAAKSADTRRKRKAGLLDTPSPSKKSRSSFAAPAYIDRFDYKEETDDEDDGYESPTPAAGSSRGWW
ncbi:hypothetical protein JCM10213_000937 [Rhodosporidiobolus nylandii]